jgi:hypothetical protein
MQLSGCGCGHIPSASLPVADVPSVAALRALPLDIGLGIGRTVRTDTNDDGSGAWTPTGPSTTGDARVLPGKWERIRGLYDDQTKELGKFPDRAGNLIRWVFSGFLFLGGIAGQWKIPMSFSMNWRFVNTIAGEKRKTALRRE